ncbi:hypothetical protein [Nonomuraea sp. NPDC049028]|uniref:hypothetical protein n=1 Tax=Nonomuraea sp. NPDC049028 TaxID=3364348 RepID=UPI0037209F6D
MADEQGWMLLIVFVGGHVAMRLSSTAETLIFTLAEWQAWLDGARRANSTIWHNPTKFAEMIFFVEHEHQGRRPADLQVFAEDVELGTDRVEPILVERVVQRNCRWEYRATRQ